MQQELWAYYACYCERDKLKRLLQQLRTPPSGQTNGKLYEVGGATHRRRRVWDAESVEGGGNGEGYPLPSQLGGLVDWSALSAGYGAGNWFWCILSLNKTNLLVLTWGLRQWGQGAEGTKNERQGIGRHALPSWLECLGSIMTELPSVEPRLKTSLAHFKHYWMALRKAETGTFGTEFQVSRKVIICVESTSITTAWDVDATRIITFLQLFSYIGYC